MIAILEKLVPVKLCEDILSKLADAPFVDGLGTAGSLDASVKQNLQLPPREPLARKLAAELMQCLGENREFVGRLRSQRMIPPRVNRYDEGMFYGEHLDNALMGVGKGPPIRTDLAMTICLNRNTDYEGGDLVIQLGSTRQTFRGDQGDVIVYPACYVHQVLPVTSGSRLVAVSWVQSQVRNAEDREILYQLDETIRELEEAEVERMQTLRIKQIRNALVRRWTEV